MEALIRALREGAIAGAGIDVCRNEPQADLRFFTLQDLTIPPHLGAATEDARRGMFEVMAEKLRCHFAGRPLRSRYRMP
ncbi:MAG: hypothetical protein JNK67_28790 [Alphaproteobacteria bacterium]|nr:hypothetical protein [Alphaproteobacteria bacterium]